MPPPVTFLAGCKRSFPAQMEIGFWGLPFGFPFDSSPDGAEPTEGYDQFAGDRQQLCAKLSSIVGHGGAHLERIFQNDAVCLQIFESRCDNFVVWAQPAAIVLLSYVLFKRVLVPFATHAVGAAETGVLQGVKVRAVPPTPPPPHWRLIDSPLTSCWPMCAINGRPHGKRAGG